MKKVLALILTLTLCLGTMIMPASAKTHKDEADTLSIKEAKAIEKDKEIANQLTDKVNSSEVDYFKPGEYTWEIKDGKEILTVTLKIEKEMNIMMASRSESGYNFDDGNYTSTLTYNLLNGTFKLQTKYTISGGATTLSVNSNQMYVTPPTLYTVSNFNAIIYNEGAYYFTSEGTATISLSSANITIEIEELYYLYKKTAFMKHIQL